ncbi:MAG: DUF3987 domain-containing protein [Parabacteroides sp.]|nr:DUF3987 domain-containing protein [Parabacteroides sp.]
MQKDDLLKWAQMSPTPVATEPNVSQSATTTMIQPADLETEVQQVVQALTSRGIDITVGYANWRNLAFALADGLGDSGRSHFHALSSLHADYNYTECDKQYTACLHGRGSGITIKTFFAMAKEAGVDLSEVFATFAKLPNGKNREKEGKIGVFDDFGYILPNGKMAKVAKSPTDTFSDKLDVNDLPLFLHPIWEHHTDPADRDKMLLGTLNAVSGIIPPSVFGMYDKRVVYAPCYCIVFGPFASTKGELDACRQLVQPIVEEMRQKYAQAMAAYKFELAAWESQGKAKQGPKPEEPVMCSPFISANSSSSAVYRALEANGGSGMIFETEADTLTNMISNKEYGNYSDLLRRAFHHETISMVRVTDQVNIEIEEPRLAVFMTCTGNQLVLLLPSANISNGLASRILFYELARSEIKFRNVFAGNEKSLKQVYREMGEQLLPLYHALAARKPRSIQFVLSQAQQEEFIATFDAMVKEQCRLSGDEMQGFIYRVALSGFRYAMILTLLRRLTEDRENYFDPHEKALICDDRDFRTMMTVMNCLANHTARVYAVLGQEEQDPFQQDLSKLKEAVRAFYQALPDQTFSSGDAMRIAKEQHIADRTANRWLGDLCSKYNLLRRIRNGVYVKLFPKQDDSAE